MELPEDTTIDRAVERRRAAEAARKARILNTRQRLIGLDTEALDKQVLEKQHRQNIDKRRDEAFDRMREYQDHMLLQQDAEDRATRAALQADLLRHWSTQLRLDDSDDIGVKCGMKGAPWITVPERELGPASAQIFAGEDIGAEERKREQMKQAESDLRAQRKADERRALVNKRRDMQISRALLYQDLMGVEQAAMEEECRRAIRIAQDNYNHALAEEQAERQKEQQRNEERENRAEMWHTLTSDMMTERPEAAQVEVGGGKPPRILVDRWKGMGPEEIAAIAEERETQCRQKQKQRHAEKLHDALWDVRLLKLSRAAVEEEEGIENQRRQSRIQLDHDNKQLANEQLEYQDYLNKKLYTNRPTKDYFTQFNTSSR